MAPASAPGAGEGGVGGGYTTVQQSHGCMPWERSPCPRYNGVQLGLFCDPAQGSIPGR